jgi:addiction module HigA family antidote
MSIQSATDHMLHPGQVLAEIYMKDRAYNQSSLAEALGCQPRKINEIVNGKRGITAEFALQLADLFETTPELWVRMQADYDLFLAIKKRAAGNKASKE